MEFKFNKEKKSIGNIMLMALIACFAFYAIVQFGNVSYGVSSASKVFLFGVCACGYYYITTKKNPLNLIISKNNVKYLKVSLILGLGVLLIVWVGYFIFKSLIDLNLITEELMSASEITAKTYPFVALYITLVNSLLEEVFFRGFIFLQIYSKGYKQLAYIFSSALFAVYHVAIFKTWFNPIIIIISLAGLFVGGLIFNYLNVKSKSVLNSWLVHACANVAIVTIGFFMFYM